MLPHSSFFAAGGTRIAESNVMVSVFCTKHNNVSRVCHGTETVMKHAHDPSKILTLPVKLQMCRSKFVKSQHLDQPTFMKIIYMVDILI